MKMKLLKQTFGIEREVCYFLVHSNGELLKAHYVGKKKIDQAFINFIGGLLKKGHILAYEDEPTIGDFSFWTKEGDVHWASED